MRELFLVALISVLAISFSNAYAETELEKYRKSIFELLTSPSDEVLAQNAIPDFAPSEQLEPEHAASAISCKSGLNLVFKASDDSPACVKPTTIFKLIERNWMKVQEAFAQTAENEPPGTIPSDNNRAIYYHVRVFGGVIPQEVSANFQKFTPFTSKEPNILPDNPIDHVGLYKFALESLPSKDKIEYYQILGKIMAGDPFADEPFEVSVDVVSGDGTVLQTWAYRNCEVENYVTYLQDTVFFFQFSGGFSAEIRDRTLLECRALDLEVPE